jgi:hypothetical protein
LEKDLFSDVTRKGGLTDDAEFGGREVGMGGVGTHDVLDGLEDMRFAVSPVSGGLDGVFDAGRVAPGEQSEFIGVEGCYRGREGWAEEICDGRFVEEFAGWTDAGHGGFVTAFVECGVAADVARTTFSVGGDGDEVTRAQALGVELVFDEGLGRQMEEGDRSESEAADWDVGCSGGVFGPCEVQCGVKFGVGGGVDGVEDLAVMGFGEVRVGAGRELEAGDVPFEVVERGEGGGVDGVAHGGVDARGQDAAGVRRAVVVFACGDVAGAAGEVDLGHAFLEFELFSSEADGVSGCSTVAVEAHGMRGVIMETNDWERVVEEGDGF